VTVMEGRTRCDTAKLATMTTDTTDAIDSTDMRDILTLSEAKPAWLAN